MFRTKRGKAARTSIFPVLVFGQTFQPERREKKRREEKRREEKRRRDRVNNEWRG